MEFNVILSFLKDLAKNNDKAWFEKNKPRYLDAKAEFEEIITCLFDDMLKIDPTLTGLEPKKLIFRIYRDVRFSKDKRPYKTNMGAAFSATGKGLGRPGYYFHIEPGNKSFIGAGLYMPEADVLAKVRQEIDYNGKQLGKVMKAKNFRAYFDDFWDGDKLKTMPKGYSKEHTFIEWLKLKSFIVTHEFKDTEVKDKLFLKKVVAAYKGALPMNNFFREALD